MATSGSRQRVQTATRDPRSAAERFRRGGGRRLAAGLGLSLGIHLALLAGLGLTPGPAPPAADRPPEVVVLPPLETPEEAAAVAVRLPPPPDPIHRPAEPVAVPEVAADQPEWIPHDIPPRLLNGGEVVELLERLTPASEQEVERMVVLWLYVDGAGEVTRLRIQRSSGEAAVDATALDVARSMRFRPALFRGRAVAVWIAQPIRFILHLADGSG